MLNYIPSAVRAYLNETSSVRVFKASAAITAGQWVEFTAVTAAPPTVEKSAANSIEVIGIALNAATAAGQEVLVVVGGYCGYGLCLDEGTGYAIGDRVEASATAGSVELLDLPAVTGTVDASSTDTAEALANGLVSTWPSVCGYAASVIADDATSGAFIVVNRFGL